MTTESPGPSGWICGTRWVTRAVALAVGVPFPLFLIESGGRILPALAWADPQGIRLFRALAAVVAGLLVAWRQVVIGGQVLWPVAY
jgi:hypothetical protein